MKQLAQFFYAGGFSTPFACPLSKEIEEAQTIEDLFSVLETRGGTINPIIFRELELRNELHNYEKWRENNPNIFADS